MFDIICMGNHTVKVLLLLAIIFHTDIVMKVTNAFSSFQGVLVTSYSEKSSLLTEEKRSLIQTCESGTKEKSMAPGKQPRR